MNKLKLSTRIAYLSFIIMSYNCSIAQIAVNNTLYTTTQLVNTVLIPAGSGTTVSSVNFRGVYNVSSKYQVGYFTTAGPTLTAMGFTGGVYLTTGNTSSVPLTLGTNPGSVAQMTTGYTSGTAGEIRSSNPVAGQDADANILISPYNYYNAAILEFDFIPVTTNVSFRYIFGSEEYNDESGGAFAINYNCSAYNDKFAFLISGPGIAGGQGYVNDAKNIARLTNGSEVGINSVNDGIVGSSGSPSSASLCSTENPGWTNGTPTPEFLGFINGTQYNGNTDILTASQGGLTPGATYHIRLLVADANDAAYDSGVFLEAGSFTTESASAGVNQIVCGSTASLNALSPSSGTWSVISGTGVFANSTSPTSNVTGLSLGANVFQWSNGLVSSNVTITVSTPPTATAGAPLVLGCSPLTGTISASSSTVGATFSWSGTGVVSGGSTGTATVNAANTYTVTVTNPANSCTSTTTVTVTSNTTPPSVTSTSSNNISCSASSAILTGTSAGSTMVWNGGTLVNAANPATVGAAATYTVTATAANGCTATSTVNVTSSGALPNISIASPLSLTCSNLSVNLIGGSTTPGATFQWSGGPATANFTVSSATTYTLTVTDPSNSCSSVQTVSVLNNTTAPNATAGSPLTIGCSPTTGVISANSTTTGATYNWTGTGIISGGATSSPTVNSTGIYTVVITDPSNGCTSTTSVTVTSNTTAPNATAGPALSLNCNIITGTVSVSSTTTGATYSWTGTSITSGGTTSTPFVGAAGTYTVTVTDPANGCTATASVTVTSNTTPPNLTTTAVATINCTSGTATLSASSSTSGVLYSWSGPGVASGGTTNTPSVNAPGTYTVIATDPSNGCTSSSSVVANLNAGPTANAGTDITLNSGETTTLVATGGGSYLWSNGDTTNSITVSPLITTDYCVTVTDNNGCTDSSCVRITIDMACGELFVPNAFSPNNDNSNDIFRVNINPACVKEMLLVIYDRWGEKIIEITDPKLSWDGSYKGKQLDNAVFVYYLTISLTNTTEVIKKSGNLSLLR